MLAEAPAEPLSQPAAPAPDRRRLALLALGHAVTDSYGSSFLSPLLPLLAARLGLSMAMVGSLPMVLGLSGSLGQPLLGYLSDRRSRLCLVALGPLVAAVGCGVVGRMPTYHGSWSASLSRASASAPSIRRLLRSPDGPVAVAAWRCPLSPSAAASASAWLPWWPR